MNFFLVGWWQVLSGSVIVRPAAAVARARHTAAVAEYADASGSTSSRWGYGTERLPVTLDELAGPKSGCVALPRDVKLLLGLYRIALNNDRRATSCATSIRGTSSAIVRSWARCWGVVCARRGRKPFPSSAAPPGMRPPPPHRRLLADAQDAGEDFELVLVGGYAVQAHGLVDLPSQDLDFGTRHLVSMTDIVLRLADGLRGRAGRSPLSTSGRGSSSGIRTVRRPETDATPLPTDGSRSTVSMAMRALVDRGLPQDLADVYAACPYYSVIELEQLGAFDLVELRDRLESVVWVSDEEFAAYGLSPDDIAELRRWALEWESDLGLRLAEDYDDPEDAGD